MRFRMVVFTPRYEVSLILPTFNEVENLPVLIERVQQHLSGFTFEILIVDDNSPDGTWASVHDLAHTYPNLRVIRRCRNRGLSAAVIDGMQAAMGRYALVMDADLQHDEALIPTLVSRLQAGADIAIGSRFADGGSAGGLDGEMRRNLSVGGARLSSLILGRPIRDALTGFFAVRTQHFLNRLPKLSDSGFKILFDLLYHSRDAEVVEVGFRFRERYAGTSKLSPYIIWQFLTYLAERLTWGILPARFISFACVGASGILVHFAIFYTWFAAGGLFWHAQLAGTLVAFVSNFAVNNVLTFEDRTLRGRAFFGGLLLFAAISTPGIVANVSVAGYVHGINENAIAAASLIGILIDLVWKYTVSRRFIWRG